MDTVGGNGTGGIRLTLNIGDTTRRFQRCHMQRAVLGGFLPDRFPGEQDHADPSQGRSGKDARARFTSILSNAS